MTSSSSRCLKRMAGELQQGEWAIWGALAKEKLDKSGQQIDICSYAEHIRRCATFHTLSQGRKLHWELRTAGMDQHRYLGNLLIQMYGNCRTPAEAKSAFDSIREKNLYSWNILLVAYAHNGHLREARGLFDRMPSLGVITWNAMHAAYVHSGDFEQTRSLFERIPEKDPVSWNTMIVAYAQNGHLLQAKETFEEMPLRNVVSYNSLISAFVRSEDLERAGECFRQMPCHNAVSWNTLLSGYVEYGHIGDAGDLFEQMPERDAVSWTALITGFAEKGEMERAREIFERMPIKDIVSWTAMITAYANNGRLYEARELLDRLGTFDSGAWNAMITGYIQNGRGREALHIFKLMDLEGIHIDKIAFFNALDAAVSIANLAEGESLHGLARDSGFLFNVQVGNSFINMYGKCGSLENAKGVFDEMPERNLVSWNAMMAAYAKNGESHINVGMFHSMLLGGVEPDEIAFVTALSGCSHGGMFRNGIQIFGSMWSDFDKEPVEDHYACMIDLLGRAGHLEEAEELIMCMPYEPRVLTWRSLLAACGVQGDVKRGERLAKHVMMTDRTGPSSNYVLVYNMFSA